MANEANSKRRTSDHKEEPPLLLLSSAPKKPQLQESGSEMARKIPIIGLGLLPRPRRSSDDGKENSDPRSLSNLKIQVLDETALIGTSVVVSKRAPREKPSSMMTWPREQAKKKKKMAYSREALEALRFADVAAQRMTWNDVHVGLGPTVRKEYDFLLARDEGRCFFSAVDPNLRRSVKNDHRSPSLSGGSRGRLSEVRVRAN